MKLYKGYSPKNVNPYWITIYKIPVNNLAPNNYAVSITNNNKLQITLSTIELFPELHVQVPIGVSNETV